MTIMPIRALASPQRMTACALPNLDARANAGCPPALIYRVETPNYNGFAIADDIRAEMMGANMHYAMREMDAEAGRHTVKPLTKGFNAAAVGAICW